MTDPTPVQYELRFQHLVDNRQGFAFPCDRKGRVDLDQLTDRMRNNYLFARALVGRELAPPAVRIATRSDTDSRASGLDGNFKPYSMPPKFRRHVIGDTPNFRRK